MDEGIGASRTLRSRLALWRSPPGQPAMARPALLLIAVLGAVLLTWRSSTYLEGYYAATVRSMSSSWHDFFYASVDPAGTISMDKLPGAFWIQALSVRALGLHTWTIDLPQVVEGVVAILVLFRLVRRLFGAWAGLLAAFLLATAPSAVTLDRGNVADTLMILMVVVAADLALSASDGRWWMAVASGAVVGLGFEAKMIEAWIVAPAILALVVAASRGPWRQVLRQVALLGLAALVVSLSWMSLISLAPQGSRPYVDGSTHDSVFQQVFVYNGLGRIDQASPNQLLSSSIGIHIPPPPPPSAGRLLHGALGRDIGWLVPAAALSLVAGLVVTRRRARGDRERAGYVLFGSWLVLLFVTFSLSSSINTYYTAALAPPLAGLVAGGAVLAWRARATTVCRVLVAVGILATVAYGLWLLPAQGTGLPVWLAPFVAVLGVLAIVGVLAGLVRPGGARVQMAAGALVVLAVAMIPTVASISAAAERFGSFDTPFQPHAVTIGIRQFFDVTSSTEALLPSLQRAQHGAPYLMATETSALAAPFIFDSGLEVLPIGGYTGTIPSPTLPALISMIHEGRFHLVLQARHTSDPRLVWISHHCLSVPPPKNSSAPPAPNLAIFYCLPSS